MSQRNIVGLARFEDTWHRCGGTPRTSWYRELVRQYTQPLRGYHTMQHIAYVLQVLACVPRALLKEPALVALALWYHDVVCVPGRRDNEERSAALFVRHARKVGLAPHTGARVVTLIRYTKEHLPPRHDTDAMLLCDIDCMILGAPWWMFLKYEQGIRKEYMRGMRINSAAYVAGRKAFLQTMCARAQIFHTQYGARRYETHARHNMERLRGSMA